MFRFLVFVDTLNLASSNEGVERTAFALFENPYPSLGMPKKFLSSLAFEFSSCHSTIDKHHFCTDVTGIVNRLTFFEMSYFQFCFKQSPFNSIERYILVNETFVFLIHYKLPSRSKPT